jgi:hypothetical protein
MWYVTNAIVYTFHGMGKFILAFGKVTYEWLSWI